MIDELPPMQRVALAYAPAKTRGFTLGLFALDAQLAAAMRARDEPVLAQLRLAFWRDLLADPGMKGAGADHPLAAVLGGWKNERACLIALVDGWEYLLSDAPLEPGDAEMFADGRAAAFAGLARLAGESGFQEEARVAGQRWALADLASHLDTRSERDMVVDLARGMGGRGPRLPRTLRPLTILDGLARRSIAGGGEALLARPGSLLSAVRLGIFGR